MIASQGGRGFGVRPLKLWSLVAALAIWLPAWAVAQPAVVKKRIGNGDPAVVPANSFGGEVDIPVSGSGNVTLPSQRETLPNDKPVTFERENGTGVFEAHVWDFNVANNKVVNNCASIGPNEEGEIVLDMAKFDCSGFVREGALIELQVGQTFAYFVMNNKVGTQLGDDIGIALTLVDRWEGDDSKGSRINNGMSFYYSLSNLKTDWVRLIGNVSLLDADPALDFETGLGLGLLFRTRPLTGTASFGLAGGVGYNLMIDERNKRWYTFVGFSMNFNQQGGGQ